SIRTKPALCLVLAVSALAAGMGYAVQASDDSVTSCAEARHEDGVLPLWSTVEANQAIDHIHINLMQALTVSGSTEEHALGEIEQGQLKFEAFWALYKSGMTLSSQLEVQDLLRRYGILEIHLTREAKVLGEIDRNYPRLVQYLSEMLELVHVGERDRALALYG